MAIIHNPSPYNMRLFLLLSLAYLISATSHLIDNIESNQSCEDELLQASQSLNNGSGVHLTLHHVHGRCSPFQSSPRPPVSTVLEQDQARVKSLEHRLAKSGTPGRRRRHYAGDNLLPESVGLPLQSGQSIGIGNYFVRLGLGTPPKSLVVVVDTGSSLNWVQCQPCKVYCHPQVGAKFDPVASDTYKSLQCSAAECTALEAATLNPPACSMSHTCVYEASYGDSSFSIGYLSKDTLTLSSSQTLPDFVYGCGQDNEGLFGQSAGLIGLARNKLSLLYQIAPKYGYAFSYCLPSESSTGSLSLGSVDTSRFSFTPMYTQTNEKSLYFIRIAAITVAGRPLAVSAAAYGATTIIDSGTVITRLPPAAYAALSKAVAAAMSRYERAPAYSILDTCFKKAEKMAVPPVAIVFEGRARLNLAAHNVMIDVRGDTTCLAFAPAGRIGIVGNRQQQTFTVAYDVARSRIGFAPGGCG